MTMTAVGCLTRMGTGMGVPAATETMVMGVEMGTAWGRILRDGAKGVGVLACGAGAMGMDFSTYEQRRRNGGWENLLRCRTVLLM